MFRLMFAAACAFALCANVFADITHWVPKPYQPDVAPGDDPTAPDFNDGSYWTVDLMVTISGNDDWSISEVNATINSGMFFQHDLGNATPPWAPVVDVYPALEYDSFYLSTEADASNQPPFKDPLFLEEGAEPQHLWATWYDSAPNGGDGDFLIARFTIRLADEGAVLAVAGGSTTDNHYPEYFPFSFVVPIGSAEEDCNNNGIPDYLDLINCDGSPWCSDCNGNWIIDECDILYAWSADCQPNGIPDECDIADGTSDDVNNNGVPDECECVGDITGDGVTDQADLGILVALWGNCQDDPDYDPAADLNNDGCIDHADLGILLSDWGCEA